MSAAQKYIPHYTVADYLAWDGDWELWAGIPVAMSPSSFGRHQAIASRVAYELRRAILESGCDAEVLHEIDWIVTDDTVVRPDVIVSCDGIPERHLQNAPGIVVEVLSNATRERDLTYKRDLYRDNGVGVYLVLDPIENRITMWSRDKNLSWSKSTPDGTIKIRTCENCELNVSGDNLFP